MGDLQPIIINTFCKHSPHQISRKKKNDTSHRIIFNDKYDSPSRKVQPFHLGSPARMQFSTVILNTRIINMIHSPKTNMAPLKMGESDYFFFRGYLSRFGKIPWHIYE